MDLHKGMVQARRFWRGAGLTACLLMGATAAFSDFVLTSPSSRLYYTHGVVAGGRMQIAGGTRVAGNVHTNGTVHLKNGGTVEGDLSAAGKINNQGTVTGQVRENGAPLTLPALLPDAQLRALADRVLTGNQTLTNAVVDDVLFVQGDVQVKGSLNGVGTVIAAGNISIDSGPAALGAGTRLSLIARGDIRIDKDRQLRGVLYAGRDMDLRENLRLQGVAVAGRDLSIDKDSRLEFLSPDGADPSVTLVSPGNGALLNTATPAIEVRYQDDLSGIDTGSVHVLLDGADRTLEADVTATGLRLTPSPLLDGVHTLEVRVSDNAGNEATGSFGFTTDIVAPSLAIVAPPPVVTGNASPDVVVNFSDATSGIAAGSLVVELDGSPLAGCSVSAASAVCATAALAEGNHTVSARVADRAGNPASASITFELVLQEEETPPAAPQVDPVVSPTREETITVRGTAPATPEGVQIEVHGHDGNVTVTPGAGGRFSASVHLHPNALNKLFVTAVTEQGTRSAPVSVDVLQDGQAPRVTIDFPEEGAELISDSIRVSGRISDMLSGFMGLAVEVNGQAANVDVGIGTNGTYEVALPLAVGPNVLTATATDTLGNAATVSVTVTRREVTGPRIELVSGDGQTAPVLSLLPEPVVIRVVTADGTPLEGRVVTFEVTRSDGRLAVDPSSGPGPMRVQAVTDSAGLASVYWTLGSESGCGNNRLAVTSQAAAGTSYFFASANVRPASQINIGSGNDQRGEAGGPAAELFRAWVSDGRNGVAGVPVTFKVVKGGGKVNGLDTVTLPTSNTGHSEVRFTFGPNGGENVVEASFEGNPGRPATFVALGLVRNPEVPTAFVGRVLDNAERPIGGAHCVLDVGGEHFETTSGVDGGFAFTDIPAGPAHLHVDGLPAQTLDGEPIPVGSFPSLAYRPVLVPNAENSLPLPVRLPALDPANARVYDGTEDVELTVEGIEGLKMIIRAGSMRRPDGTMPSPSDPAIVALNQVHSDDVPMPFNDGAAPPFAWTLQPTGAQFNPPIEIVMPNMAGLPGGAIVYFLSFNHETERFEIVGTGRASDDGSELRTDPGEGIAVAGWGGFCPPYPNTGDVESDNLDEAKKKMREDYANKQGTAAAGLSHQILCLGESACAPGADWADGFVGELLQDIADNRQNNPSPADRVCQRIPSWLGAIIMSPGAPPGFPPGVYNTNDVCALAGGIYHFKDELAPGFERHMRDQLNDAMRNGQSAAAAKQEIIRQHEGLLMAIPNCFRMVNELSPIPREIAARTVPPTARALRGSTLAGMCPPGGGFAPLAAEAPLTREDLFSPELDELSTLRVSANGLFFLPAGTQVQLRVTDRNGNDVTSSASGTQYFVAVGDDSITVSPEGLLTITSTSVPQAGVPPVFYVYAGNGQDLGIGQFAVTDTDADGDLINDSYELAVGLDPTRPNGLADDADGDGVSDVEEAFLKTRPTAADSDGDGVDDGDELDQNSDPLDPASSEPVLGRGATVTIAGRSAVVRAGGSFRVRNVPAGTSLVRGSVTMTRGGRTYYGRTEFVEVVDQQTLRLTRPVALGTTPPPTTVSIAATPDAATLNGLGTTTQMRVSALVSGGARVDVTAREMGTTYRSSNPAIASVDPEGRITAVSAGIALITALNEGAVSVRQITVSPDDPLTTVSGFTVRQDDAPIAGATVAIPSQDRIVTSGPDGSFEIPGVATLPPPGGEGDLTLEPLTLSLVATARTVNGEGFVVAFLNGLMPVPGGVTNAGRLTLRPFSRTDTDGDGVPDEIEVLLGTDPAVADSDGDHIPDGLEDRDGDSLPDFAELVVGTDPNVSDTDADGLEDGAEDADGDGLGNREEVLAGTDGFITDPLRSDSDGDGMLDGYESRFRLNPNDPSDPGLDPDGDGLTNLEESVLGTDPFNPDRVRPAVSQVSPPDGSAGSPFNGRAVVRFTEPLLPESVAGAVRLFDGTSEIEGTALRSDDGISITFAPAQPLAASRLYTLRVSGVRDLAFNLMEGEFTSSFTTGAGSDTVRPTVVRSSPLSGQADVPVNAAVTFEFSERMDPATLTAATLRVRENTGFTDVEGVVQVTADGRTATFVPRQPLPLGRSMTVILSNSEIEDAAGNDLTGSNNFSFTTAFTADHQTPVLTGVSPMDGTAGVPLNAPVVLQFDEALDNVSVTRGIAVTANGVPVAGAFALSGGSRRVTFTPASALAANTLYTVAVSASLTDLAGNALGNPGSTTFQTGTAADTTRPTVTLIDPANNATGVGTDAMVRVSFSEPVSALTVTTSSFQLLHEATSRALEGSVTVAPDGRGAVFTSDQALEPSTRYRVEVRSDITDLAAQTLSFFVSTFTTAAGRDTQAPTVVAVSPPNGATGVPVNAKVAVRLSEPVAQLSVGANAILITTGGNPVAGSIAVSSDRMTLTFTPSAALAPSTAYNVQAGNFTDRSGNAVVPASSSFTTSASATADTTRPSVTAVSPVNNATGVSVLTSISWTFNELVDPGTVNGSTMPVTVDNFTGSLPGTYSVAGTVVTFMPAAPLPGTARVRPTVNFNQVLDLAGNGSNSFSSLFSTAAVADTTPPQVLLVTPSEGSTDVGPNAVVVLTFSEPLDASTINTDSFDLLAAGEQLNASVTRSADNQTVTLSATLPAASTVTVVVTDAVKDLSGNRLANFQSRFATARSFDAGRPSVASQRPGNGATGVVPGTSVVLYVNEPLNTATIPGAFFVSQDGVAIQGDLRVTGNGRVIEFVPAAPWEEGALVQVFLTTDARDLQGNRLNSYQGSFRVAAVPQGDFLEFVDKQPSGTDVPLNAVIDVKLDRPLDAATFADTEVTLLRQGTFGSPLTGTMSLRGDGQVVRMVPSAPLQPQTGYIPLFSQRLPNGSRTIFTGSFTTGSATDVTPPSVTVISPPDGETGVGLNANVGVRFDEPVNTLTVSGMTVLLTDGTSPFVPCTITFNDTNRNVTIVPHAPLKANTAYSIRVEGVEDLAGNPVLVATASFTTGTEPDTVAPAVLRTSPFSEATSVPVNSAVTIELDEPVDPVTVGPSSFVVREETNFQNLPGTYSVSGGGRIVTFVPDAPLPVGRRHNVFISNRGMADLAGNRVSTGNFAFTASFTADSVPPQVLDVSPRDGWTDVPLNGRVAVRFDEPVASHTVSGVTLSSASGAVTVKRTLSDANRLLVLTPLELLGASTAYTVNVQGVRDLAGNLLASPRVSGFTTRTGADLIRPAVSEVDPANNATGVATNARISLLFNDRVLPDTVTATSFRVLHEATSRVVSANVTVAADGRSATLAPVSPLEASTRYQLQASGEITDLAGQPLSFFVSAFTTAAGVDTQPPAVVAVSPQDGTSGVPVNARVAVRVSEPVSLLSLGTNAIIITTAGNPVAGAIALSTDRQTITFTPAAPLATSTSYSVQIGNFRDRSGNLVASVASSFTTSASAVADTTRPSVTTVSPANNATGVSVTTSIVWTFNEPVDPGTVNVGTMPVTVDGFTGSVPGTYSVAGAVVTFTPAAPLPGSARVRPTVNFNQVLDLAGNGSNNLGTSFVTAAVADTTPPQVVLVTPSEGSTDVGPNAVVVVTFSEPLDASTIITDNFDLLAGGEQLNAQVTRSADNQTVTLSATLPAASTVTVVVTDGVKDLSGNRLATFQSRFTTAQSFDAGRPSVTSQRPGNGATNVVSGVSVVLYVNERLDPSTIPGALFVSENGVPVTGSVAITGNGRAIEFTPDAPWQAGSVVQVFLTTDAQDLRGNSLNSYQGSFRVASPPPAPGVFLQIVDKQPSGTGVPLNAVVDVEFDRVLTATEFANTTVKLEVGGCCSTNYVTGAQSLIRGGQVIRMVPGAPLLPGTSYSFVIEQRSSFGTSTTFTGLFTTGMEADTVAPAVALASPPQGETGVGLNAYVRVRFDERINPLTVSGQTVLVTDGVSGAVPCTIAFGNSDRDVVIVPHRPLKAGTAYSIRVEGVEDLAGNLVTVATSSFTTGIEPDTASPVALRANPFADATGVPVNSVVTVELNEPVDPVTVSTSTFTVREEVNFTTLPGTYSVSNDGRTVTFVPDAPLPAGRRHNVFLNSRGIEDLAGNRLTTGSFAFTTAADPDVAAPQILEVGPRDGWTAVPLNGRVAVRFDEPVGALAIDGVTLSAGGSDVAVKRTLADGNRLLTLTPIDPLDASATCSITVDGVRDLAGNLLAAPSNTGFATGTGVDLVRPAVSTVVPANNTTGVSRTPTIVVTFNDRVQPATVTSSTFRLLLSGNPVAGTVTVAADGRSATFTPAMTLNPLASYQIQVNTGVTDLAGQTVSTFTSNFTTGN